MKTIPLTQGKATTVDEADYDRPEVGGRHWAAMRNGRQWYAARRAPGPGSRHLLLHRVVLGLVPGDPAVDHINGDGLDNRRENLRLATKAQNGMNQAKTHGVSQFKGVYWDKVNRKWVAQVRAGAKVRFLGRFDSEEDAAQAYDAAAREAFGEYARTNFEVSQ